LTCSFFPAAWVAEVAVVAVVAAPVVVAADAELGPPARLLMTFALSMNS
jgi:hypothetical protein